MKHSIIATAAGLAFAAAAWVAQAGELRPIQAQSIDLGQISGVAYYTVESEGFRVVATLADGEGTPLRVRSVLASGQSVVISTPAVAGAASQSVEFSRLGNKILVREDALID